MKLLWDALYFDLNFSFSVAEMRSDFFFLSLFGSEMFINFFQNKLRWNKQIRAFFMRLEEKNISAFMKTRKPKLFISPGEISFRKERFFVAKRNISSRQKKRKRIKVDCLKCQIFRKNINHNSAISFL